jgi:hypothetical protein
MILSKTTLSRLEEVWPGPSWHSIEAQRLSFSLQTGL